MYIEEKLDIVVIEVWIGKVVFLKFGKIFEYCGRKFKFLKGVGYKVNFYDVVLGKFYWIFGCCKDGNDGFYRICIYIDVDICCEYWLEIRGMFECKN